MEDINLNKLDININKLDVTLDKISIPDILIYTDIPIDEYDFNLMDFNRVNILMTVGVK